MTKKGIRILIHVVAWTTFFIIPFLFFLPIDALFHKSPLVLLEVFIIDLLCILFYYFNYHIAVPRFFFTRKYFIYTLQLLCWLGAMILIRVNLDMYPEPPTAKGGFAGTTGVIVFRFIVIAVISFSEKTFNRLKQTEEAKLKTELSYLKAQINPHFLFNTLNSIYTLIIKKSDHAADAVHKLSGIMRYVMNEAEHDVVALEKEITYVTNYIDLQRLRLANNVEIRFDIIGDINEKQITPLILLPLIENAFKHGVSMEEPSCISIQITVQDQLLKLLVTNKKVRLHVPEQEKSGKGIINTKHRLQLLYPGRHILDIDDSKKYYTASLNIEL